MKVIILAARGNQEIPVDHDFIEENLILTPTSLSFIIKSLKQKNISDITVIGGKGIDQLLKHEDFAGIRYNPFWDVNGMLHSLSLATDKLDQETLIIYGDVIFDAEQILNSIDRINSKVAAMVFMDSHWKTRYSGRSSTSINKAEKISLKSTSLEIQKISTTVPINEVAGEFAGILYLSHSTSHICRELLLENNLQKKINAKDFLKAHLIDLIQELINRNTSVIAQDIAGRWAETEAAQDIYQFIFSNKAQTLNDLRSHLKKSSILPSIYFSVKNWRLNKNEVISKILTEFNLQKLVVRSSTLTEDQVQNSSAGVFKSLLKINPDASAIVTAVEEVIASYASKIQNNIDNHLILVQPFFEDVLAAGVLFTYDPQQVSPYYTINYAIDGSTDGVTSGCGQNIKCIQIFRKKWEEIEFKENNEKWVPELLSAVQEIEKVTGVSMLDIEFVISNQNKVIIFQVRPLIIQNKFQNEINFGANINEELIFAKAMIDSKINRPHPLLFGSETIFSDMADWNPAEIIGQRPRPLAISLYNHVITSDTWGRSRSYLGYNDVGTVPLMQVFAGKPYIDTRASFNSLLPNGLNPELSEKIINFYISKLKQKPSLHDKIEFEIALTTISSDFDERILQLQQEANLTDFEVREFTQALKITTKKLIAVGQTDFIHGLNELESIRKKVLELITTQEVTISEITLLLDGVKNIGAFIFANAARLGFFSTEMLRSFVRTNIFTQQRLTSYLESIQTVTTVMVGDFKQVQNKKLDITSFLKIYGHLRPGTYDILSARYDEAPDLYFDLSQQPKVSINKSSNAFILSPQESNELQFFLKQYELFANNQGATLAPTELLEFLARMIQAREYTKFIFTRTLSDALSLLKKWGALNNFSVEELSYFSIPDLLHLDYGPLNQSGINKKSWLHNRIHEFNTNSKLILPPIIDATTNLKYICFPNVKPNYVTQKKINGSTLLLTCMKSTSELNNKIILIESADPGYDWIFNHNIKGLITMYGGAASHMTIRCSELGIPAAIGCGTKIFSDLSQFTSLELDCQLGIIRGLH